MTPPGQSPALEQARREAEAGRYDELNRLAAECLGWMLVWDGPPGNRSCAGIDPATKKCRTIPNFAEKVDAVKEYLEKPLIEKGCDIQVTHDGCSEILNKRWAVQIYRPSRGGVPQLDVFEVGATEPIARTIAALSARQAEEGEK